MNTTANPSDLPLPSLDPLLHQPIRTQIAAFLNGRGEATFAELKRALGLTDGNLDAHMSKLIDAAYVAARKEAASSGRPQTIYALTDIGREALARYVAALSSLLSPVPAGEAVSGNLSTAT
jgi:predicted ArsR family transcriptional regulator